MGGTQVLLLRGALRAPTCGWHLHASLKQPCKASNVAHFQLHGAVWCAARVPGDVLQVRNFVLCNRARNDPVPGRDSPAPGRNSPAPGREKRRRAAYVQTPPPPIQMQPTLSSSSSSSFASSGDTQSVTLGNGLGIVGGGELQQVAKHQKGASRAASPESRLVARKLEAILHGLELKGIGRGKPKMVERHSSKRAELQQLHAQVSCVPGVRYVAHTGRRRRRRRKRRWSDSLAGIPNNCVPMHAFLVWLGKGWVHGHATNPQENPCYSLSLDTTYGSEKSEKHSLHQMRKRMLKLACTQSSLFLLGQNETWFAPHQSHCKGCL
eukprot:1154414-Pelagomonas_calceolata.AAC.2